MLVLVMEGVVMTSLEHQGQGVREGAIIIMDGALPVIV